MSEINIVIIGTTPKIPFSVDKDIANEIKLRHLKGNPLNNIIGTKHKQVGSRAEIMIALILKKLYNFMSTSVR